MNDGGTADAAREQHTRVPGVRPGPRGSDALVNTPDEPTTTDPDAPEPSKKKGRRDWIIGLIAIVLLVIGPIVIFIGIRSSVEAANADDAWAGVPTTMPHTDHSLLMTGTYETGGAVNACGSERVAEQFGEVRDKGHREIPPREL